MGHEPTAQSLISSTNLPLVTSLFHNEWRVLGRPRSALRCSSARSLGGLGLEGPIFLPVLNIRLILLQRYVIVANGNKVDTVAVAEY
jgi:hypothetical protein